MHIKTKVLSIKTVREHQYLDLTEEVEKFITESKVRNGIINLFSQHTTSALVIQENDSTIHEDTNEFLRRILPLNKKYRHDYEGNLNATAHIKNQIFGGELTIPIINGNLGLGRWQKIFFLEFLEGRERNVVMTIIGE